jgi:hypothetical protein
MFKQSGATKAAVHQELAHNSEGLDFLTATKKLYDYYYL